MVTSMSVPVRSKRNSQKALWHVESQWPRDLLIFCPACKALEVLRFSGSQMIPTRKFTQRAGNVYHDCGTHLPCRLHVSRSGEILQGESRDARWQSTARLHGVGRRVLTSRP